MRATWRLLLGGLTSFVCLMGLCVCPYVALAESAGLGGTGGSSAESSLLLPGAPLMLSGEGVREAEEAKRTSPEAVAAREASQTEYEGLGVGEAAKLAGEVFPEVVGRSDGGLPQLPEGASVAGYPSDDAVQVDLPGGKHGLIESMEPIAAEITPGRRVAMNLGLVESSGGFEPLAAAVDVRIARRLQNGVSLGGTGVSLTPVTEAGGSVGGVEGQLDGSVVFYGGVGVGSDVDEVVKPEPEGFSEDAILRSVASPGRLEYRVGLPEGASLVEAGDGSGAVNVVDGGSVIAAISAPVAQDAAGVAVPVSMSVNGDSLAVSVHNESGQYELPILVDPRVVDKFFTRSGGYKHTTNWHFVPTGKYFTDSEGEGGYWEIKAGISHSASEYGVLEYTTQGESKIEEFGVESVEDTGLSSSHVEDLMEMESAKSETEAKVSLPEGKSSNEIEKEPGSAGNTAEFLVTSNHAGEGHEATALFKNGWVAIEQSKGPEVSLDTSHENVDGGKRNVFYGSNGWIGPNSGAFEFHAKDPGVGISEYRVSVSQGEKHWEEQDDLFEGECTGGFQCPEELSKGSAYNSSMPEGEDTLVVTVKEGTSASAETSRTLDVDNEPPYGITLSGLPSNHEVTDGQHIALKAGATDGMEGKPSSGIVSIMLEVDGRAVSGPQGYCSPGPCTGSAEWTLDSENYPAGEHTLTVVATDNAGNVAKEEYHLTIHHPEGVQVGPGSVNPVTGELSMAAGDVSVGVPGGALMVSRSYRSRHLAQGTEGPLGPQWSLTLGGEQSLYRVGGGIVLTGGGGEEVVFESKGSGEFNSPTGDAGLTLLEKSVEGKAVFTLSENGSVTTFELPSGGSGGVWMPSSSEGPDGTSMTLYKFKVKSGVIEPTEELAPVPAGVSCGKEISELKEGCRALKFEYDEGETTAKGEKQSEWGEFAGHLSKIRYIAWNASKTKEEPIIATYEYDKKGRLRAEWNPEIKPNPVKAIYGYDSEGHVTALSTTGHEPLLLEQGTIPSDASPGRLLAVAVPSAGTALGGGEAPVNTEAPTLSSTTPKVGVKISVSLTSEKTPGKWSAGPLAFTYQWEDCNSAGKECTPIPGAVNQAYYPVAGDEGHTLVAQVSALNATGAVTAWSGVTSAVASGTPNTPLPEPPSVGSDAVTTLEYQVPISGSGAPYEMSGTEVAKWGQVDDPSEAMAVFPPDKVMGWPAKEYKRETVYYLDGKDRAVNTALPTGGISTTEYNAYNDVKRTLSADNRQKAMNEGCKSEKECKSAEASKLYDTENTYEEKGSEPGTELLSTLGPQHTVKLAVGKEGRVDEEALAREHTSYAYNEGAPSEGGPYHLVTKTIDSAETAGKEFDSRTTEMGYGGQSGLGWKLRKPTSVTTDPSGLDLVHTTEYNAVTGAVIETKMPAAAGKDAKVPPTYSLSFGSKGSGAAQFGYIAGDAVDSSGNVWVVDYENNRIEKFSSSGAFIETVGWGVTNGNKEFETCKSSCKAGIAGSGEGQFDGPYGIAINKSSGDIYVTELGNYRVQELSSEGKFIRAFGSKGTGSGQFEEPLGLAIDSSGEVWVTDAGNNCIDVFSSEGASLKTVGKKGTGKGEFMSPNSITFSGEDFYVSDFSNYRIEVFSTAGSYLSEFGSKGSGPGQFDGVYGIAEDPNSGDLYITDAFNARVEKFTPAGVFLSQFGTSGSGAGQFKYPFDLAVNSTSDVYVTDYEHDRVEEWVPTVTGNEGAHDTKTIYYTTAANSGYKECGEHPAIANLPCERTPAAQPATSELPELPTTKYTYNIFSEPETATETVGSTTRTKTDTYDTAGRLKTSSTTSTVGTTLPAVTDEYNSTTGALEKQSSTNGTITSILNKLGELESYTDAAGNKTTYEYDIDGRTKKTNDEKGTETYTYSETSGLPVELINEYGTSKLTFTASYDAEGNMLTESYPNSMTATYTYNTAGKPTALEYKKEKDCATKCPETWLSDSVTPSIHGQWIEQTSTLSHQAYAYDNAGRLTEVQTTPAGKSCTVRLYTYDEDSNRVSLTTREPGTEGKCATESGSGQGYTYDTADRLTEPGIIYNTFGDITTLPAQNSEDPELTSSYYTDNQLATQKQNKQTISYTLDPAGRTLEADATGEPTNADILSHYTEPNNTPTWTENKSTKAWKRNITGINGSLTATQAEGANPVLQLTNLHGDIIATASTSETTTELLSKTDTSEYGVPTTSNPEKYAWLGAMGLPTELPSGVIAMGARSYIPQLGRFLQPDPIPGGSANAYTYTFDDPINTTDPTGAYVECSYCATYNNNQNTEAVERENARIAAREAAERAAREAAERAAAEAAAAAAAAAGPQYQEGEESEEWEEEGEYEYASYKPGESGQDEHHLESGVLYQPLGGEAASNGTTSSTIPLCEAIASGPCARSVPNDKNKNDDSKCNETGQDCGRRRSRPSRNEGVKNACDMVGVAISITSIANIPADIVRGILGGGGAGVTALCRQIG
jgi:RHS repeat-associated protein